MAHHVVKLPDIGEGTTEAEIVAWHVKPGDAIREEDPLVDVMTEKATVEIPSPVSGTVVALSGAVGEKRPVGSELATLEVIEAGRGAASSGSPPLPVPEEAAVVAGGTQTAEPALRTTARPPVERPLASPAVRKRAADRGLDLHLVPGTGPGGRVTQQDLDAYTAAPARPTPVAAAPPAERRDGVEDIAILGLRRTIAERLQEAARHIPHFAFIEEVDVTAVEELRQHLNATPDVPDKRPRLTLLPFLVRAIVNAVAKHRQVNARFDDEAGILHRYDAVHMGIATQTAAGLMVPVVRHAEALDLWQTAVEIVRLAEAARAGKAVPTELTGSTITITSLGRLGGLASTPIINRPEVAIIGINRIAERPMVRGGQVVVRKMMNLSSSFDHRIVDGWEAAAFIQRIKGYLEQPATSFIKGA
jgi:2-oxoisovalerate dehydrogenase E2 component (dihydrolipoyl transacylase)